MKYHMNWRHTSLILGAILCVSCGSSDDEFAPGSTAGKPTGIEIPSTATKQQKTYDLNIVSPRTQDKIHMVTINEENAAKLDLVFDNISLPAGGYVEIIDGNKISQVIKLQQTLASGVSVRGSSATIRLVLPASGMPASLRLKQVNIEPKIIAAQPKALIGVDDRTALECFNGTNLYNRSLAASASTFGGWGSGSIVGNGKFTLTNAHVSRGIEGGAEEGAATLGWFNEGCNAPAQPLEAGIPLRTNTVIKKGIGGSATDYALISLNQFDVEHSGALTVFGSMRISPQGVNQVNDEIYIPQYGNGGLQPMVVGTTHEGQNTKITSVADNIYYNVDTQGGSSGSPVISPISQEVVGLHWGGGTSNIGVRLTRLQQDILPLIAEFDNVSVIGQGKYKGSRKSLPPFRHPVLEQVATLPVGGQVIPFSDVVITHYGTYSEVELASQNSADDDNVVQNRYRLALKTATGSRDLSTPTTSTSNQLLVWNATPVAPQNGESSFISWLPLRITNAQGELIQNRILHLTRNVYDAYTAPFDANAPDTVRMNLNITNAANNTTVSQSNDGAQFAYIASYKDEGPTTVAWTPAGSYADVYVPLKRADGNEVVVKLRGYRGTDCSTRPMNAEITCNGSQKSTLRLDYVAADNANLATGTYKGIFPVLAQKGTVRKNILVNIEFTK